MLEYVLDGIQAAFERVHERAAAEDGESDSSL
jgi:hypothetical protein